MTSTEQLAATHDDLPLLTNESSYVDFAETIRITCALEYRTSGGVTDADYLAERAARDCLYGTSLTPRLQGLVRRACVSQMRRLFERDVQGVAA